MTSLFLGGSLATLLSGIGWRLAGWTGVCITGVIFSATAPAQSPPPSAESLSA